MAPTRRPSQPSDCGAGTRPDRAGTWLTYHALVSALLCALTATLSLTRPNYLDFTIEEFDGLRTRFAILISAAFLANYGFMLLLDDDCEAKRVSRRWAIGICLPSALVLLAAPPMFSRDTTAYLLGAHNWVHAGLNPYTTPLNALPGNPWLAEVGGGAWWISHPLGYGPLFYSICAPWVVCKSMTMLSAIYLYRAFLVALFVVSVLAFRRIAVALALSRRSLVLYALNPAVLIHTALDGHSDFLIAFAIVMALLCLVEKRWAMSVLWIALSAAVKYYSVVALPACVFRGRRLSLPRTAAAIVILGATMVIAAAPLRFPFGAMVDSLRGFQGSGYLYGRAPTMWLFDTVLGDHSRQALLYAAVVLYGLIAYLTLFRRHSPVEFVFWSVTMSLFMTVRRFGPWYIVTMVPPAALLASGDRRYAAVLGCLTLYSLMHFYGV